VADQMMDCALGTMAVFSAITASVRRETVFAPRPDGLGRARRLRPYLHAVDPTCLITPPSRAPTLECPYRPR
jgi:hypothetical protein